MSIGLLIDFNWSITSQSQLGLKIEYIQFITERIVISIGFPHTENLHAHAAFKYSIKIHVHMIGICVRYAQERKKERERERDKNKTSSASTPSHSSCMISNQ